MEIITKICSKCGLEKLLNEFYKNSTRKDGYDHYCKVCHAKYKKAYYINNHNKIMSKEKEYRENNKEQIKQQRKNYEINNKEKVRNRHKQYYLNNKEKVQEYHKQYYIKNKEYVDNRSKKWKVNNKNKVFNIMLKYKYGITVEQKNQMIIIQNNKCACCKDPLDNNPRNVCIDHDHITGKLRKVLCQKCNKSLGIMEENVDKISKLLEYAKYCNKLREIN